MLTVRSAKVSDVESELTQLEIWWLLKLDKINVRDDVFDKIGEVVGLDSTKGRTCVSYFLGGHFFIFCTLGGYFPTFVAF